MKTTHDCSTHCTAQKTHALVADIDRRMLIDRTQWTLQQNRDVISALKRENKELKDSLKTQPLPEKQQVRALRCLVMQGYCFVILHSHCETALPGFVHITALCSLSPYAACSAQSGCCSSRCIGLSLCVMLIYLCVVHLVLCTAAVERPS